MKRWLATLLLALPTLAGAAAYTLPGNLPPGCTGSNGSYTCAALVLGYGDTLAVNTPKPASLTINGKLDTSNAQINQAGSAADLRLVVTGTLTLGYQARIKAQITAHAVTAGLNDGSVVITGSLAASGGSILLADTTTVTGDLSASGSGDITTGRAASIGGSVTAGSGSITVSETAHVAGGVGGSGPITLEQRAVVEGDLEAGAGAVALGFRALVKGKLSGSGSIALDQEARVAGHISGGAGHVGIGYAASVVGTLTTSSGSIGFDQLGTAASCVKSTAGAAITLGFKSSVHSVCCGAACTNACVTNDSGAAMPPSCAAAVAAFTIGGTGNASTCTPQVLTLTARDASGHVLTGYTGTVQLSTSTGRGTWSAGSAPAPAGSLVAGGNNGQASYSFAAGDAGVVRLRLAHGLAQNVTVSAADGAVSATSATIAYRDNAFLWAEDLGNAVAGTFVAVAGRTHDMQVSLIKKDATTLSCGVDIDYAGSRHLKLWRSDSGGPWAAPTAVTAGNVATTVPTARPGGNNLTLNFTAGVARFNLTTSDVGKYAFHIDEDSLAYAAAIVSGTSLDLTVRPYALAVTGLTMGASANPGGSAAADGVFGPAGAAFAATVTAYRWSGGADADNDGLPDPGATLAQVAAGGVAPGFSASVVLTPGAQTPAGGVLGALANNVLTAFNGGSASRNDLAYSEVGSFALATGSVVVNYLGTPGLALDALAFNATGHQQTRVGRFIPAGFALGGASVTHRVERACTPASAFTYLDEDFRLAFTLTARNAAGATTRNYSGAFARLDLATAANLQLAGIAGTTMFKPGNGRLALAGSTGNWVDGVAGVTLNARALRAAAPDGPFDNAAFGIAPVDADGATMLSLDLDTDSPADGADRARVSTIPLRAGRLRLQNGMAAAGRTLKLPLAAQYWTGSAYDTNTLDSCTRISAAHLSFGNLRHATAADAALQGGGSLAQGLGRIELAAPAAAGLAAYDVALALDAATPPADASCLAWTPPKPATAGAGLAALRGAWCGNALKDPSARAVWGLYRGSDGVLHQREHY